MEEIEIVKNQIKLEKAPDRDVCNGLLVEYDRKTETLGEFATADILEGQQIYPLDQNDNRKVINIYLKGKIWRN